MEFPAFFKSSGVEAESDGEDGQRREDSTDSHDSLCMAVHSLSVSHDSRGWCEQGTIIQSKNGKAWNFGKGEIEEKIDGEGRWVVLIAGCDKRGKRFTEGSLPCCRICLYLTPRANNKGHGAIFTHKHRKLGDAFIQVPVRAVSGSSATPGSV